jgi:hypothetical protein
VRLLLRTGLLAATASSLAILASACGGDSIEKVDVDDWVADVCDRAVDFDDDFADAGSELDIIEDGDPDEIKDAIDQFVKEGTDLIDDFVKDVEEVGQPDIDGGDKVIKAIKDHAKDRKKTLTDFKGDVDDLDDDDDDDFRDDVFDLLDDVEEADLRDRFEDIDQKDVDDLTDMIDDEPGCGSILFNS